MKRIVLLIVIGVMGTRICAQTDSVSATPAPTEPQLSAQPAASPPAKVEETLPVLPPETPVTRTRQGNGKHGLGINFGLNGLGADYAYMPGEMLGIRARFQTFPFRIRLDDIEFSDTYIGVDGEVDFTSLDFLIDFYPFKSSFKIIGGLGYFIDNRVQSTGFFTENLNLGEFELSPEDVGQVTVRSEWAKLAPYMGLGFGRSVPRSRIGFGFEIGTYYGGAPDVTVIATEMLSETSQEEAQLEENLKDYAWIPYLNFRLSIRII